MAAKKELYLMRVTKGALEPADGYTRSLLRAKGYKKGDSVFVSITKPRNPGYHRLAHSLGAIIAENVDAFAGLDAHAVLKRLQLEGNIECDEIALIFPGLGPCAYRVPKSLSFASMGQDQFEACYLAMCRHVSCQYWPLLSADEVAEMADVMANE